MSTVISVEKRQISDHIKVATPSDESDKEKEQQIFPRYTFRHCMTIQEAVGAIQQYRIVNKAIEAFSLKSKAT